MSVPRFVAILASTIAGAVPVSTAVLLACAPVSMAAQSPADANTTADPLRAIGLSVMASGGPRDTLGLLVSVVTRDGPADQAGITAGSRILAINGVAVRLAVADVGVRAAADSAVTRFARAIRVTPPDSVVTLRVAGGGQTRTVAVSQRARASVAVSRTVVTPSVVAAPPVATPTATADAVTPPAVTPTVVAPPFVAPAVAAPAAVIRPAVADTLVALEALLTTLRQKLQQMTTADSLLAQRDSGRVLVAGLALGRIHGALATYLGPTADSALLVMETSAEWVPVEVGDVVMQVDGATPDAARLRASIEARRSVTLALLRRGRSFTVSVSPSVAP